MTKFWANPDGTLARATSDDGVGPDGSVETVGEAPHGRAIYDFDTSKWTDPSKATREFKYARRIAYPEIGDQLDDIYHNGIDGWKSKIKVVKDKYPKP